MRKIFYLCGLFLLAITLATPEAFAFNQNRTKLRDRLTTLRNWQLMEDFDLTPEKSQQVFTILKKFDDQRVKLIRQRQNILERLRDTITTQSPQSDVLEGLMLKLSKTSVKLARIPEQERRALAEIFSPREQARYILFVNDFAKDMRRVIKNSRKQGRDRRF